MATPPASVYIDLNDFKEINDTHGHQAGDEALKHVADILLGSVRDSDVVGRLGGDEFGIILDKSGADAARERAEALRQSVLNTLMQWKRRLHRTARCLRRLYL